MTIRKRVIATLTGFVCALASPLSGAADDPWPAQVVTIDKMRMTTPLRLNVPTPREVDRTQTSTVVLHIHVDEAGQPVRLRIEQSSGNPNLDETVLRAVRQAKFEPYLVEGRPTAVTVVAPMHFPFRERRR